VLAFIVLTMAALVEAGRFDAISSGDETAKALGVNPDAFRGRMMIVIALFVATSVVAAGVIVFVGLVTPHVARLLVGAEHRRVGPTCVLLGATFLVLVDLIARTAFEPTELPLSVVTAVFGVPFFIWLLRRRRGALATVT
jgi:iron complex transport system permease protein